MYGGTIENCGIEGGSVCYGGGVAVFAGGSFIMDGGIITECYATTNYVETDPLYKNCYSGMGGGVFVSDGSVFTMNGGTITNNTSTNFGGGIAMTLSDIEVKIDPETGNEVIDSSTNKGIIDLGNPRSKVIINGGTISNNKSKSGAGVFASGLYYAFCNTVAAGIHGTGFPSDPGLYINGGEISSNTATDMGGGVMVVGLKDPKKAQIKNAEINNNTANKGAGICVYKYWTKALIDNCRVINNSANSLGGGIYLEDNKDNGAGTTVKDSVIKENTAGNKGGGVYYTKESVLNIEGSDTIQNNTVNGKENNLYFQGTEYPVNVTGSLEGSKIGITDARLFEDDLEDYAYEALSSESLTDGFVENNAFLMPARLHLRPRKLVC